MDRSEINERYFNWLCNLVHSPNPVFKIQKYSKLLSYLYSTSFNYTIPMDGNRAEDGIELRYRFAHDESYDYPMIASCLDDHPCSILEMLVALSVRCEDHIMWDPDEGNRTGRWFWDMITSLGLCPMNDLNFDIGRVEFVIDRFLNREYERDGAGGLFTVKHTTRDMRSIEIWYQLCLYLEGIE